jgi:hypothetical protein
VPGGHHQLDRQEDHGGLGPSLSPVAEIVEDFKLWLSGELNLDGPVDERGYPRPYPCPQPGLDFELAAEFRWTWQELQDTPVMIRDLWTRLLMERRAHEAKQLEKTSDSSGAPSAADRREAETAIAEAEAATADDPEVQAWRAQLEQEGLV